jgi:hypothetical protein
MLDQPPGVAGFLKLCIVLLATVRLITNLSQDWQSNVILYHSPNIKIC